MYTIFITPKEESNIKPQLYEKCIGKCTKENISTALTLFKNKGMYREYDIKFIPIKNDFLFDLV